MKTQLRRSFVACLLLSLSLGVSGCSFMETIMQLFGGAAGQAVTKQTGSSALGSAAGKAVSSVGTSAANNASTAGSAAKPAAATPAPAATPKPETAGGAAPAANAVKVDEKTAIDGKDE